MAEKSFHVVDYIVFLATLIISLGIGLYFAFKSRQGTTGEYLMAGRNLKILPVALSILVSFVSAVGILGGPAEMYAYGTQYSLSVVAAGLGCFLGAMVFVPLFYPLKLTSSFEYLELRYHSKFPRLFGTCLALFTQTFTIGTGFFAPSSALEAVTGFPVWLSMILCGVTAAIYTTLGGMKAVIWTDVFQSVVIFLGLLVVVIQGTIVVGGFGEVWHYNEMYDRIHFFDISPDPTKRATFWSVVVVMSVLWMCVAASQPAVQRYCALPNLRAARSAVLMNIPGQVILGVLTSLAGIVVFAYYAKEGCDPLSERKIRSPNQILPYFVMDVLGYPGLPGLFVACLYSGALSTASSSLNAMAAVTWEDIFKIKLGHLSDENQAKITKVLVAVYGALGLATGFIVQLIGGTFVQIVFSILGTTAGPLVGLYLLGGLWPRAGARGAMIGSVLGLILTGWIALGAYINGLHTTPLPMPRESCPMFLNFVNKTASANLSAVDWESSTPHSRIRRQIVGNLSLISADTDDNSIDQNMSRIITELPPSSEATSSGTFSTVELKSVTEGTTQESSSTTTTTGVPVGVHAVVPEEVTIPPPGQGEEEGTQGGGGKPPGAGQGPHARAWITPPEPTGLDYMYSITYLWYPSIGIVVTLVIGVLTSFIPGLCQSEPIPDTLLFPCARSCGRSCFSAFVVSEKDVNYTALSLQRGDTNTLSLRGEVKRFPPPEGDESNGHARQGEDGEEIVLGDFREKLLVDVSESSI